MKYILLLISFVLIVSSLYGQKEERAYRHFATQEVHARLLKEDAKYSKEVLKIERKISKSNKIENHLKEGSIPLYFHILYNNEKERITYEQIISQIQVLNEDFALSLQPDLIDFQQPYGNKENGKTKQYEIQLSNQIRPLLDIKFCLAKENGNNSSINYVSTKTREWRTDDAIKYKKSEGADIKQPNKYLNVWIGNLADNVSGYAQMPGGPTKTDGIVIDYRFFGVDGTAQAPYDLGRTMTHLIGNYLGLYDLWSETLPCGDDFVADTPVHNGPNFGCPQYLHISTCFNLTPEMTMNFMDNTDDVCMSLFTVGQMKRMYQMLAPSGPRHGLLSRETVCDIMPLTDLPNTTLKARNNKEYGTPIIQLSPNPSYGTVNLGIKDVPKGEAKVHVYSTLGQLVYTQSLILSEGNNELSISTDNWQSGIYFLHVQVNEFKIAKQLSVITN